MIKFLKCAEDVEFEQMAQALQNSGITVLKKYKLTGLFKIEVPDDHPTLLTPAKGLSKPSLQQAVQGLTVTEVYDDFPVKALLDQAVPRTNVDLVWKRLKNEGEGMVLGICDTGVDLTHGDLSGRILGTADFTGEGDFDGNGHGTHCATIAVGDGSRSNGKYRGAAPKAKLYMTKGLDSAGQGSASSIVDGIEWLHERGVHVISLSLGGTAQPNVKDILQMTCEAAVDAGIVVFCAAGNSGPGERTIATPGVSPKVITVGASDDHDQVASFSSRGPTVDGFEKPDVVAPGVNIIAGRSKNTALGRVVDDYYVELSGTSMATPFAAGIALLMLEANGDLKPAEIKAALENTALDLKTGNDNVEGEGRIDAYAAITGGRPRGEPEVPIEAPEPACLLRRLFGSSATTMTLFYFARDRLLAPMPGGHRLIAKYYQLSKRVIVHRPDAFVRE